MVNYYDFHSKNYRSGKLLIICIRFKDNYLIGIAKFTALNIYLVLNSSSGKGFKAEAISEVVREKCQASSDFQNGGSLSAEGETVDYYSFPCSRWEFHLFHKVV